MALENVEEFFAEAVNAVGETANAVVVVVVKRPMAVATSASAMPGATTARLAFSRLESPVKAFMMPQTVPKRPM